MNKINWDICQVISNQILNDGLNILKTNSKISFSNLQSMDFCFGNYLISESNQFYYIGESKNINSRIIQHSKKKTSTFYKNYLKKYNLQAHLEIKDFNLQIINTNIGRKELEEFSIVNLPTILNKFQKGKRKIYKDTASDSFWDYVQKNYNQLLSEGERSFFETPSIKWFDANLPNNAGIYFIEHIKDGLIYIGESSNICERYNTHSNVTYFSALRRHIGTDVLNFFLKSKNGRKRYFTDSEDIKIDQYLENCKIRYMKVDFGRFEFEEYLIKKYKPLLNRKENK